MFFFTGFRYSTSFNSYPYVTSEIYTDKEIYNIGDTATIKGHIKINSNFQNIIIKVYVFDWSDGSTFPLIDAKRKIIYNSQPYLRELNGGEPVQWLCNKTSEYGIMIHVEKENDTSKLNVSFLKARFIVIENEILLDVYTDRLIYVESQIVNIFGKIISSKYYEDVNIEITLNRDSKIIRKLYNEYRDLPVGTEINFYCQFNSSQLFGDLYIQLNINSKNTNFLNNITRLTKIQVRNRTSIKLLADNLITRYELLTNYPDLLLVLCETGHLLSNFTNEDEQLLNDLVEQYHNLTETERKALFFLPSCGYGYTTTGDLIYWLMTDFSEKTGLWTNDTKIILSYAAVFDDFFIRENKNDRYWKANAWDSEMQSSLNWIKEYMIGQCRFFGVENLRKISISEGVCGLMHLVYPNFGERFGDLRYQFMPLEAYQKIKRWAEDRVYDGQTIEELFTEQTSPRTLDKVQSFIWSEILSEQGSAGGKPTTAGFYESEVTKMLNGERFPGSCETVSRLTALIGRSLPIPVGIVNPSGTTGHWGNYQIFDGKIVPDSQSQSMFNLDQASSQERFIINWPSLHYYSRRGYGTDPWYRDKFGDQLPEFSSEMDLESFLSVILLEMIDTIRDPVVMNGSIFIFNEYPENGGCIVAYIDGELRGFIKLNSTSNYLIRILINREIYEQEIKFELLSDKTWYSSLERIKFTGNDKIPEEMDLRFYLKLP